MVYTIAFFCSLDWRNREIVIAESLARVIAVIQIASVNQPNRQQLRFLAASEGNTLQFLQRRARSRRLWSLRFYDESFVPLSPQNFGGVGYCGQRKCDKYLKMISLDEAGQSRLKMTGIFSSKWQVLGQTWSNTQPSVNLRIIQHNLRQAAFTCISSRISGGSPNGGSQTGA